MRHLLFFFLFATTVLLSTDAFAEPWLSNRYAQNCAACHAPGRVNRPAIKRRCTLSCQGCHVNPNGGGLRNFYGKYNQNKWLHSLDSKHWKQGTPPPAPYSKQPFYDKRVDAYLKKASPAAQRRLATKLVREGATTRYLNSEEPIPRELYTKEHAADEYSIEPSDARYEMRIPKDDPYRQRRLEHVTAGGDFRYFVLSRENEQQENQIYTFPMAMDFGLRYMPVDKVSLVTEARFLNGKAGSAIQDVFNEGQIRSAYVMVDDLMYNTYAMYGLYRPMFGHYTPDHNSLFSLVTGLNQYSVLNGFSMGTAPNVPFANIHYFTPTTGGALSGESGFAVNLGARFVTNGLSFVYSYWSTDNETTGINRDMMSFNAGGTWGRFIINGDLTTVEKEIVDLRRDKGAVSTLETKYRMWEETYAQLNYAMANTTPGLTEGSSSQLSYGFKTFLLAGMELEVLAGNMTVEQPDTESVTSDYYLMQFHLFF